MTDIAEWISTRITTLLPNETPNTLLQSMQYSLNAGGKRIRPILLIATIESLGKDRELGLEVACAIEMIHTYSLIHDDLPAMDNDDFRRGIPTNHKVFGDGIAILAGDALLTHAFQLISTLPKEKANPDIALDLVTRLSIAAGPTGMVGGQVLDLDGEKKNDLSLNELERIHRHKTGDLIHYSVYAGVKLAQASKDQINAFSTFARKLGLAFQIQDDLLDVIGSEEHTGKPVGSDQKLGKSTYPVLMGVDAAKKMVETLVTEAKNAIDLPNINPARLFEIADYFAYRVR